MQNVSLISGGCNTPGGACGIKADSISGGVINGKRSTENIEKRNLARHYLISYLRLIKSLIFKAIMLMLRSVNIMEV